MFNVCEGPKEDRVEGLGGGGFKSMLSTRMQLNSYLKPAPWLD